MSHLKKIPVEKDFLFVNPHRFTVIEMQQHEIRSVMVEYIPVNENSDKESNQKN